MNLDNLPRKWEESEIRIPRPKDEEAREKYPEMALPDPPPIIVPRKLSLFKELVGEGRFSKLQKGALVLYLFVFPVVFTALAWIFGWGPGGVVLFHALAGGTIFTLMEFDQRGTYWTERKPWIAFLKGLGVSAGVFAASNLVCWGGWLALN